MPLLPGEKETLTSKWRNHAPETLPHHRYPVPDPQSLGLTTYFDPSEPIQTQFARI